MTLKLDELTPQQLLAIAKKVCTPDQYEALRLRQQGATWSQVQMLMSGLRSRSAVRALVERARRNVTLHLLETVRQEESSQ